jgi:hypothetical protein
VNRGSIVRRCRFNSLMAAFTGKRRLLAEALQLSALDLILPVRRGRQSAIRMKLDLRRQPGKKLSLMTFYETSSDSH